MVAIDTLVHNFLHRTGVLHRLKVEHSYGPACYGPGGCAEVVSVLANCIDAGQFNRDYPKAFPRFVQSAIWRYCAQTQLNICNGNQIDDSCSCINEYCRLFARCDKVPLKHRLA